MKQLKLRPESSGRTRTSPFPISERADRIERADRKLIELDRIERADRKLIELDRIERAEKADRKLIELETAERADRI